MDYISETAYLERSAVSAFCDISISNLYLYSMKTDGSFFQKVYEVVMLIPPGRVTSYGAIANYLSAKGSARMVGWAMNASHASSLPIPAHRVVNRNGMLTGKHHFGSPDIMQQLLENEGLTIKNDKILDFKKHFWDPEQELL